MRNTSLLVVDQTYVYKGMPELIIYTLRQNKIMSLLTLNFHYDEYSMWRYDVDSDGKLAV